MTSRTTPLPAGWGIRLPLDEVGSTAYEAINQALKFAWKNDGDLFEFKYGRQHIPYEAYPNQRMDMTDNVSDQFNLAYTGQQAWGTLKARAYYEHTQHEMDFGDDKRYWYGGASGGSDGDRRRAVLAHLGRHGGMRRRHADVHRRQEYRYQPACRDSACRAGYLARGRRGPGLSPRRLVDAFRRRHVALHLPQHQRRPARPLRRVRRMGGPHQPGNGRASSACATRPSRCDAGQVHGYNLDTFPTSGAGGPGNQTTDAVAFNTADRSRTDHNWDLSALARYVPEATQTYEIGVAQKTRSPNLYERYTWSTWQMAALMNNFVGDGNGYVGNLNLEPEVAHTLSLAADWHDAGNETWNVKLAPYYTHVKDYIDAVRLPGQTGTTNFVLLQYANQSARLYGVDLSGHALVARGTDYGDFTARGVVSYTRGENRDTGDNLYNIMPLNARLALTQKIGAWRNTVEGELVARKSDVSGVRNEMETPGYGLVHLRGRYEQKRYSIDFGIENLFDRFYALPLGGAYVGQGTTMANPALPNYPQWGTPVPGPGRSVYAGLNVQF